MSGQDHHPHILHVSFSHPTAQQRSVIQPNDIGPIPIDLDDDQEPQPVSLLSLDQARGLRLPTMFTDDPLQPGAAAAAALSPAEQIARLQEIASAQQKQLQAANEYANRQQDFLTQQAEQLQESRRQLQASQQSVNELTEAFNNMSTTMGQQQQQRPGFTPKKKPDLPPFDKNNIIIWLKRLNAAYDRVGVIEPKDKFAWLESIFQVGIDPKIDQYLYGTNTLQDWEDFQDYLLVTYGPTRRQKTIKLMGDIPRQDLKPTQYLAKMKEDTKDVTIDDIHREHLLRTIPPRIREIMGKAVESMTAEEVAVAADDYFDRQGRPLEKNVAPINNIDSSSSSSSNYTQAFSDDETDVNYVNKRQQGSNSCFRSKSRPRGRSQFRDNSRNSSTNGNNSNSSSANNNNNNNNASAKQHPEGTCYFHRKFGDKSTRCVPSCPRYSAFKKQQGNGQGGRRM